jgi:hypothetical protein
MTKLLIWLPRGRPVEVEIALLTTFADLRDLLIEGWPAAHFRLELHCFRDGRGFFHIPLEKEIVLKALSRENGRLILRDTSKRRRIKCNRDLPQQSADMNIPRDEEELLIASPKDSDIEEEMTRVESIICTVEQEACQRDLTLLAYFSGFEGMLSNPLLRAAFQLYLETNHVPESLKFWEYAEDFRRSHYDSPEPFAFRSDSGSMDAQSYALGIYQGFLEDGAKYQVSDCSFDENRKIMESLQVGSPPPTLFSSVQRISYVKLKFSDGHYPSFITHTKYRNCLLAALHATHCHKRKKPLFATCVVSKVLQTSAHLVGGKRTSVWERFNIFGIQSQYPAASKDVERDNAFSHLDLRTKGRYSEKMTRLSTPWRRLEVEKLGASWLPQSWWDFALLVPEMGENDPET